MRSSLISLHRAAHVHASGPRSLSLTQCPMTADSFCQQQLLTPSNQSSKRLKSLDYRDGHIDESDQFMMHDLTSIS